MIITIETQQSVVLPLILIDDLLPSLVQRQRIRSVSDRIPIWKVTSKPVICTTPVSDEPKTKLAIAQQLASVFENAKTPRRWRRQEIVLLSEWTSAVRTVFFSLWIEQLSSVSKVTSSKYLLNKFNCFMAPHCCGFCCRSFSTWWAIMGQYKDFKEMQDLDHC